MISIIITSYKEPNTIGKAIRSIADPQYSGIPDDFEIIQISPDKETLDAAMKEAETLGIANTPKFKQLHDERQGKPTALNQGIKEAIGEILIMTDGDVFFDRDAVAELLRPFEDESIGGVTGRPSPSNERNSFFGYLAHLLSSAADHKRKSLLEETPEGYYKSDGNFIPLSGYILAIRNQVIVLPKEVLVDDTYISGVVFSRDQALAYAPEARAIVKYTNKMSDYFKQRRRTIYGHKQLRRYKGFENLQTHRSLRDELAYFWYPLKFANNLKELIWSVGVYKLRAATWVYVVTSGLLGRLKGSKEFQPWEVIESTK